MSPENRDKTLMVPEFIAKGGLKIREKGVSRHFVRLFSSPSLPRTRETLSDLRVHSLSYEKSRGSAAQ